MKYNFKLCAKGKNIFHYPKYDPPSRIYSCPDAKMFSSLGQNYHMKAIQD